MTALRRLGHSGYWMPLTLLALIGTVAYRSSLFWVVAICAAIGLGPWFAASRLLDRITELEVEVGRVRDLEEALTDALREAAHAPVPLVPFDSLSRAERVHIAADRPELHIVPPASADMPVADDAWFARLYDENGDHR
jgi:hypothetical protein